MTDTILTNCAMVDVRTGAVVPDAAVRVAGDRVLAVDERTAVDRTNALEVDLEGAHLLPGLINCHVHFGLVLPGAEGDRLRDESEAALALRMAANAEATLRSGVTTVRLVGERPYADVALRSSIVSGETVGPRVICSGPLLVSIGGHGWELGSCVEASGADGFRAAAREQLKHGVDWVKISISGGIAGEGEAIADAQMTSDEMCAVVETAHARGRKVAAHAGPPGAIASAAELGVDSIEHGYFLTADVTQAMADAGTWLVPTINVSRAVEFYERIGAPDWMIAKALEAGKQHWAGLEAAIEHGVRIAMGTDMMPHEPFDGTTVTVREIEYYAEAGLGPLGALRTATLAAAEMLELSDEVGTIEVGKRADLIAVAGNPLDDIGALRELRLVMAGGTLVRSV